MSVHGFVLILAVLLQGYDAWKPTNMQPRTTTDVSRRVLTDVLKRVAALGIVVGSSAPVWGSESINSPTSAAFYDQFQYQKPTDILKYLDSLNLKEGDAPGLLRGLETFASYYPMYALSHEKANILIDQMHKKKNILEIGSFFGYSALSMAYYGIPSSSTTKITCIEANPENAAVARRVIQKGLGTKSDRVQIKEGISTTLLKSEVLTPMAPFDFVFLDHDKDTYIVDLKLLESRGWLTPTCTIVADNVVFPGAPGYLEYVMGQPPSTTSLEGVGVNYRTKLIPTPFERIGFETQWKEVTDAMSVSERLLAA